MVTITTIAKVIEDVGFIMIAICIPCIVASLLFSNMEALSCFTRMELLGVILFGSGVLLQFSYFLLKNDNRGEVGRDG